MISTENEGTVNSHKILAAAVGIVCGALALRAQSGNEMASCAATPTPPFCRAVRGDRAGGWLSQSRSEVMAPHGMVAASQPLAAQAGLRILSQGGNAIDAAVASAAVLSVVEPMMVGVGGDLFAIIYVAKEHKLYALNASGTAPSGATIARFAELGYHADPANPGPTSGMPPGGILTATVPGTVWGWDAVLRRFGTRTFQDVLAPAIDYAENGFPVSERIAGDWTLPAAMPLRRCCSQRDPDSLTTWYINGRPPAAGQRFRNPDLARTFRLLQQRGSDAFYKGEIANAIVAKSTALGGTMTLDDLSGYKGQWVEPATSSYHGVDVFELPPPSQAWGTNEMLNILEACVPKWAPGQTLASLGPASPLYWHLMIEAKKLAYADLYRYNADPDVAPVPVARLLSKSYAASLCSKVDPRRASGAGTSLASEGAGDTIVLSAGDSEGNMVSWVNSNFNEFGSGITVPGYGFVLHNRGQLFTLDPGSPNAIAPHKRPYNTLSAGFVMRNNQPLMTVTLMGGEMQAQGHAQILVDVFDFGANLQAASDMARFRHSQVSNIVRLESPLYRLVGSRLSAMGHQVQSISGRDVGGVQWLMFSPDPASPTGGFYRAASDHRKDGQAAGW
jgi:gamma-glutamyltranspeptidase/glutathione hydrolase